MRNEIFSFSIIEGARLKRLNAQPISRQFDESPRAGLNRNSLFDSVHDDCHISEKEFDTRKKLISNRNVGHNNCCPVLRVKNEDQKRFANVSESGIKASLVR